MKSGHAIINDLMAQGWEPLSSLEFLKSGEITDITVEELQELRGLFDSVHEMHVQTNIATPEGEEFSHRTVFMKERSWGSLANLRTFMAETIRQFEELDEAPRLAAYREFWRANRELHQLGQPAIFDDQVAQSAFDLLADHDLVPVLIGLSEAQANRVRDLVSEAYEVGHKVAVRELSRFERAATLGQNQQAHVKTAARIRGQQLKDAANAWKSALKPWVQRHIDGLPATSKMVSFSKLATFVIENWESRPFTYQTGNAGAPDHVYLTNTVLPALDLVRPVRQNTTAEHKR